MQLVYGFIYRRTLAYVYIKYIHTYIYIYLIHSIYANAGRRRSSAREHYTYTYIMYTYTHIYTVGEVGANEDEKRGGGQRPPSRTPPRQCA